MSQTALLVLGMHRSGTSALAGALSILGARSPASSMKPSRYNPRGYFESAKITAFNDALLASAGSTWRDWRRFDERWRGSREAAALVGAIPGLVRSEFGAAELFVLKDPRLCRFAPVWIEALEQMDVATKIVVPLRNPLEAAHSLRARSIREGNGPRSRSDGLRLWLAHCLDAEFDTRGRDRAFVQYDDLIADWRQVVDHIATDLSVEFPAAARQADAQIEDFLRCDLRHHRALTLPRRLRDPLSRFALEAYDQLSLLTRGHDAEALSRLSEMRTKFDNARRPRSATCLGAARALPANSVLHAGI